MRLITPSLSTIFEKISFLEKWKLFELDSSIYRRDRALGSLIESSLNFLSRLGRDYIRSCCESLEIVHYPFSFRRLGSE